MIENNFLPLSQRQDLVKDFRPEEFARRFLLFLIIAGSGLRIFVCFQHNPLDYRFSDPQRHWMNGERFFTPDLMGASDPLLYQIYLFALQRLTSNNQYLIALASGFLSVGMPWTYYRAARENGMARIPSLWAWAAICWVPSLATIYHYFMMETLLLPLVGVALWQTGRDLRKQDTTTFLVASFFWSLAIFTKPTVLPLAGVCLTYAWWRHPNRLKTAILGVLLLSLMATPNAIRTYRYLGYVAPFGNEWITRIQHRSGAKIIKISFDGGRWGFASPSVCIMPMEPLSHWAMQRAYTNSVVKVSVHSSNGEQDWEQTYNNLHIGIKEWLLQLKENVILFLFAPSWPDCNQGEWDGWITYMSRWAWGPLIFFLIDCNIRDFWHRRFFLIPLACTSFTIFLLFQNVATTEGRYRKPLEPLLLLNLMWTIFPTPKNGRNQLHD